MIIKAFTMDEATQLELLAGLRGIVRHAPLSQYEMPRRGLVRKAVCSGSCEQCFGEHSPAPRAFGPLNTNSGSDGWVSDRYGYWYRKTQPDGTPWPAIPDIISALCERAIAIAAAEARHSGEYAALINQYGRETADQMLTHLPQSAYVNYYRPRKPLGRHQDISERVNRPVVSMSIGAAAWFHYGGQRYSDLPDQHMLLNSGDCVVFGGRDRYVYHAVDAFEPDSTPAFLELTTLCRLNTTVRQVDEPTD